MVLGIDISHHNSEANIKKVLEKQETSFIIMKATEGRTFVDNTFSARMKKYSEETSGEKCVLGAYHFARPENGNTAEAEASNFISQVMPFISRKRPLILGLDIEGKALAVGYRKWYSQWLNVVSEATGIKPIIYVQESGINLMPISAYREYGLWVAKWNDSNKAVETENGYGIKAKATPKTLPWPTWAFWQYKVDRDTNIDLDIFNGDFVQLKRYGMTTLPIEDEGINEENACHCGCKCCGGE